MFHESYHPNLQPRHCQNGIGNLEHDHIISYLNLNKKLNCGTNLEKCKADKEKRLKKRNAKNRLTNQMSANTSGTRFDIVKRMLQSFGFTLHDDEVYTDSYLIWSDGFISQEKLFELRSYQHINHFMGMVDICRKDYLAKNFSKMQKVRPNDYNYFPKTWLFPLEKNVFQKYVKENKNPKIKKYFILKPSNGAMGNGIQILSEDDTIKTTESCILQEYIDRPFLLDGFKNDLRIYVLVTCCDPLTVFIYREGLVRLSTEKYILPSNPKSESHFMHLTNYSVNKKNSKYSKGGDESSGSKRSLSSVMNLLKTKFKIDTEKLWKSIIDIIVKTLLLAQPNLIHNYKMCRPGESPESHSICFEILGFDILLDQGLRPWLLEVNRSPSFGIDEALDEKVKGALLNDTLRLLNIKHSDKRKCVSLQKQRVIRRLTLSAVRSNIDVQLGSDDLKRKRDLEKRKQELIDLYMRVKSSTSKEYFENRNMGNFTRIFPPEEKYNFDYYSKILIDSFIIFNQMHSPNSMSDISQATNQTHQCFMQNQFREEDLLDQIKECEKEENKILEKFNLQPNVDSIIFKEKPCNTSSDDDSESTLEAQVNELDISSDDNLSKKNKHVSQIIGNKNTSTKKDEVLNNRDRKLPTSKNSQRSTTSKSSLSMSIESNEFLNFNAEKASKGITLKNISSNKSFTQSSISSKSCNQNSFDSSDEDIASIDCGALEDLDVFKIKSNGFRVYRYDEVLKTILTSLKSLTIRYPGQSDQDTRTMLVKIHLNWELYRQLIATYWLVTLNSIKREKILQIVKKNVDMMLKEHFQHSRNVPIIRLLSKLYNRLLWNRGHGLIQCFTNIKSWRIKLSNLNDQIKPCENEICSRVVQLCLDCVLIVYKFSNQLYDLENESNQKQDIFCA